MSDKIPKNQVRSRNSIEQHEHEDNADARRVVPIDQDGDFFGTPSNPISVQGSDAAAGIDTPTIFNISTPVANTEYSQVLPVGTAKILVKVRDGDAIMRLAYVAGDTDINYISVSKGCNYLESDVELDGKTVYFQLNKASKIVEILAWST